MGFKLNGMNFGKGTGSAKGFSQVTLNPNTRDDPNSQEYIDWHTKKYGYPPPGDGTGQAGATVEGETYEDLKNKEKASETNKMMFEDLTNRLEDYKNDPFRVEVGPIDAYYKPGSKGGKYQMREWLKSMNPKQIKQLKRRIKQLEELINSSSSEDECSSSDDD